MSKSRDIGDSAATINFIDNLTSDAQTQLNTLTTNVATNATAISNINVTTGSQTKTYGAGETSTITLSGNVLSPVVGVTKEVAQTGTTNNAWDVNSSSENYTRYNSAPATTLNFNFILDGSTYDSKYASVTTNPVSVTFNTAGSKMYVTDRAAYTVYQYSLSTANDASTATSDSVSYAFTAQSNDVTSFTFDPTGTKAYITDVQNHKVRQYTLSTAFDISTMSYASKEITVSDRGNNPLSWTFNSDGTKGFVVTGANNYIWKYTLSTAYDLATASYEGTYYDFSGTPNTVFGHAWSSDGLKLYVTGATNTIYQFNLSTAFTFSGMSNSGVSVSLQGSSNKGLGLNYAQDKFYVPDDGTDRINQYSFAASSMSLGSGSFASADVGKTIEANSGVFRLKATTGTFETVTSPSSFNQVASGSWQMYGVVFNTTDGDLELSSFSDVYNFGAQNQLSNNTTYSGDSGYSGATHPVAIHWGEGSKTRMVTTVDMDSDQLLTWQATAANDLSSFAKQDSMSISGQMSSPTGFCWADNGNKAYICDAGGIYQYTITSSYQASGSYASKSLTGLGSVSGVLVSDDGTQIYACKSNGSGLYHYTMSTAFDLSTASVASGGHFSLPSQAGTDDWADMVYQDNGNKLFIIDTGREMFEYNLSTAYRIETASFVQKLNISTPSDIKGFDIRADGSRFYAVGSAARLYEFSIGAGVVIPSGYHAAHTTTSTDSQYWTDINSMTADEAAGDGAIYYCVSTDDRTTWKVAKGTDGERSIVRNNSGTWQYNSNGTYGSTTWANATTNAELSAIQEAMTGASSGYSLTNASYNSVSFSISSQETDPLDLAFKSDGTKLYVIGRNTDAIYQYSLSTAWDLSTASYDSVSFSVASQENSPSTLAFSSDGTKIYVSGYTNDTIFQYSLSTAWDLSTASYASLSFSIASQLGGATGIVFKDDGTKLYATGQTSDAVFQYSLSTAYNISTASYDSVTLDISSQDTVPAGIEIKPDGTKLYIIGYSNKSIYEYTLSTAFDLSTASYSSIVFSVSGQGSEPNGLVFKSDGTKFYHVEGSTDKVYEYSSATFPNQMNKTQLDAIPDANHFTLANDLDLGIIFNLSSGSTVPSSDGVAINYDANVLNQGAILGTDYTYDAPAQNKVRITSTNAANLKVRIL